MTWTITWEISCFYCHEILHEKISFWFWCQSTHCMLNTKLDGTHNLSCLDLEMKRKKNTFIISKYYTQPCIFQNYVYSNTKIWLRTFLYVISPPTPTRRCPIFRSLSDLWRVMPVGVLGPLNAFVDVAAVWTHGNRKRSSKENPHVPSSNLCGTSFQEMCTDFNTIFCYTSKTGGIQR